VEDISIPKAGVISSYQMLIGDEWKSARSGNVIESINPATEEVIATVPEADESDIEDAVEAARKGFTTWRSLGWRKRQKLMLELADRMAERAEQFALLDTLDSGNPYSGMLNDARMAPEDIRYFANLASELKGTSYETPEDTVAYSVREPFGVVGRIIPFNHPYRFVAKIAPCLAAGNTVILKPGETTSLSALEFGKLCEGLLPPGVVNIVTGLGHRCGSAIVKHPDIMRVAFTGSVPTGQAIMRDAATHMKRLSLELGGKNPMIVFPDVDLDKATTGCIDGMNLARSMGQSCQSNSRVFVHDTIHDRFVDALVAKIRKMKIGDPRDGQTEIGPVNNKRHFERILGFIDSARSEGATLAVGGKRSFDKGYFVDPTVFTDVTMQMRIGKEEIFGPVISVFRWSDFDTMMAEVNGTEFGLTANIWTNDLTNANKAAKQVQSGLVWINGAGGRPPGTPFGGYKLSGIGKEGDLCDLLSYTQEKMVITHLR
jgi:betaine-aldehyde dehydrogenase